MLIDYDKYSLKINNKRALIRSAAIHYFRMPGQDMWRDRLSKLKAAGYNAIDVYFNWGYHSKEQGKYDFTGIRNIRALLDIAAELGLFVIARPGPYINAEVSLGGLPAWLLNKPNIHMRNRKDGDFVYSEIFMKYLREWYSRIIPILNEYHNIIAFQVENEYFTNEAEPDYIQELYDMARSMGIKVPIFHNDVLGYGLYSDIVNIYAFDNYPSINMDFDWREFSDTFGVLDHAESNLKIYCPDSPLYVAELQAGWYDKWNGFGYEHIRKLFGREHINIVTKTALSQGITMFNHYMGCGGTSWGQLASSEVYTSYDFAAPVTEAGFLGGNYYKTKEINTFLKGFNLSSTDLIAEGSEVTPTETENTFAKLRKDNLNNCKWLFIRNLNKKELKFEIPEGYSVTVSPHGQPKDSEVNSVTVKKFDMKILPVGLNLKGCRVDFSGMSIFGRLENEHKEIILILLEENNEIKINDSEEVIKAEDLKNLDSREFTRGDNSTKFIFIDQQTADKTWALEDKILIGAEFLTDDLKKAAFSENSEVKIITLDEEKVFNIAVPQEVKLPDLQECLLLCGSPELDIDYDYSGWNFLREDKFDCITNEIYDDYIWYKGNFKGHIDEIEINAKHCYAIYLNGKQIFYHDCLIYAEGCEVPEKITFNVDKKFLNEKGINELTVLTQNLGFDRGFQNELKVPRGILSIKIFPEKNIEWQIRGGLTPIIEEWTEAPSESGLSSSNTVYGGQPSIENTSDNSRIRMLYATFEYQKDANIFNPLLLDVSELPFERADIFLNGKMIGRHWETKCPQDTFYLPEGFLVAKNIVSLVIWNVKPETFHETGCKTADNCVKIKIGNIKPFKLISLNELI